MKVLLVLLCAALLPPGGGEASGWHTLRQTDPLMMGDLDPLPGGDERWFWDSRMRIWRASPDRPEASSPEEMGCDFIYVAAGWRRGAASPR
jgi:hypothetical protein